MSESCCRDATAKARRVKRQISGALPRQGWDVSRHVYGFVEDGSRMLSDLELFAVLKAVGKSPSDLEVAFQRFGWK